MEIKVLIVDDEEPQRRGLRRHVPWGDFGMRVVGEAESAEQGLAMAEAEPPDLMVTDIRMLGATGLELIASMRALNPGLRVVVVTGYEQFEYAKAAVDLAVDAFLVKPIDFQELGTALTSISRSYFGAARKEHEEAELRERLRTLLPMARQSFCRDLLEGFAGDEDVVRDRARYLEVFLRGPPYLVAVAVVEEREGRSAEDIELVRLQLQEAADAELGERIETAVTTERGDVALILGGHGKACGDVLPSLERFRESAEAAVGCTVSIGVGSEVERLGGIADSYRLAQLAVNQRVPSGCGQIIRWKDITEHEPTTGSAIEVVARDLLSSLRRGDKEAVDRSLTEIVRALVEAGPAPETDTRSVCLGLMSGVYRCAMELGVTGELFRSEKELWKRVLDAEGTQDMVRVSREVLGEACELFRDTTSSRHRLIVRRAIAAMRERFGEDLALADVAATVFLSPSYLGAVLRSETGQSFTEILTGIRIEKAKELLSDLGLKLYEVSDRIGYQNPAYFSAVFKRQTGLTPKEYRESRGETT